jgi:hypothetical protein
MTPTEREKGKDGKEGNRSWRLDKARAFRDASPIRNVLEAEGR